MKLFLLNSLFLVVNGLFLNRKDFIIGSHIHAVSASTDSIKNEFIVNEPRSIVMYGDIDRDSCFYITQSIRNLQDSTEPIHLHIQSLGGELLPTFNVVDTIEKSKAPVYSYIEGYAASAATLISVACHKKFMNKHSLMLIHQLSGMSEGTYSDMKEEMTNMNIYMAFARDIYFKPF